MQAYFKRDFCTSPFDYRYGEANRVIFRYILLVNRNPTHFAISDDLIAGMTTMATMALRSRVPRVLWTRVPAAINRDFSSVPTAATTATTDDDSVDVVVLTREYIYGALYAKDNGYFTTQDRQVLHAPPAPIDFTDLWGAFDYRREVATLYKEKKEAWLTPVEVFAPYYSHAIAKYMLSSPFFHKHMTIYEIGGGAGTNALHILNYLKVKPSYTLIRWTGLCVCVATGQLQR